MEIGLGHKGCLAAYLGLNKGDSDIAEILGKVIDSKVVSKDEMNRLLFFIRERIWGSNYLQEEGAYVPINQQKRNRN